MLFLYYIIGAEIEIGFFGDPCAHCVSVFVFSLVFAFLSPTYIYRPCFGLEKRDLHYMGLGKKGFDYDGSKII